MVVIGYFGGANNNRLAGSQLWVFKFKSLWASIERPDASEGCLLSHSLDFGTEEDEVD